MGLLVERNASRKPHLFMSHSSKDKDFVRMLSKDLNVCEIDVWLDEWEMKIGDSLIDQLSKAIEESKFIAVILSEEFFYSKWGATELKQAFTRELREERNLILPILIEKVHVPPFIEDKLYIDFTSDYYSGVAQLAGVIHGIDIRAIKEGISYFKPKDMNGCIEVLRFCGFEPYTVIDEAIFNEILRLGGKRYENNRVRFNLWSIYENEETSLRTKMLMKKLMGD